MNLKIKDIEAVKGMISLMGYSIRGFAKHINVSSPYLGRILQGNQDPYPPTARKIADGLGVKISDIFFTDIDSKKISK